MRTRLQKLFLARHFSARAIGNLNAPATAGLPGYETGIWFAMAVPKATPAAIVARLNAEVTKILKQDDMKTKFDGLALELTPTSSEDVSAFSAREQNKWSKLVKEKRIRLEQ